MLIDDFKSSNQYRFKQLVHTLKHVYGLSESYLTTKDSSQLQKIEETCTKLNSRIISESSFNSWMQDPKYTRNMLIIEAVKYLLEIAPKRQKKKKSDEIDEAFISMLNNRVKTLIESKRKYQLPAHLMESDEIDEEFIKQINNHPALKRLKEDMVPNVGSNPAQAPDAQTDPKPTPSTNAPSTSGQAAAPVTTPKPNGAPQQTVPPGQQTVPNGMLSISKNGVTKTIPAAQLSGMQSQGWAVNGSTPNG